MSVIMRCFSFLTPYLTKQVLQTAEVLSHLDYYPIIWSGVAMNDLGELRLAQNRATRLAKVEWHASPG